MPTYISRWTVALTMASALLPFSVWAQSAPAPPLVTQLNNGNWLPMAEAEALRDELYYQRAVHTYVTMLPEQNTIGIRDGSEAAFNEGYNILPIWKDRMDARIWVPTPNADVIYSMSYLDFKESGPLVVAAPRNATSMFTDFFQRTLTDVGLIGQDRARGGLYLRLPLDYDGEVPQGYFFFKSRTCNIILFFRTITAKGGDGPGPKPAVALAEQIRVYGFWSLTMYNEHHFFHPNDLKRYSLGTKNKSLKHNADGSLTPYAGNKPPGADKESNCLPAPAGKFLLYVCAYWGRGAILDES